MSLVLSSSLTFQSALATPPTVTITAASTPVGVFSNGGTVTSTVVQFSYRGTEDDNSVASFRCTLDGASYPCPIVMDEVDSSRNKIGTVTLTNLTPRATEYVFEVVSVNNLPESEPLTERESTPASWRFTVSAPSSSGTLPPIAPSWTTPGASIITPYSVANGGATNDARVTFHYRGTEDDDYIRSFRCTLSGPAYVNLPVECHGSADPRDNRPTKTGETRNKVGSISIHVGSAQGQYTFSVVAINNRPPADPLYERESLPAVWQFIVSRDLTAYPPDADIREICGDAIDNNNNGTIDEGCPTLRLLARDGAGNDITGRTTVYGYTVVNPNAVTVQFHARGQLLDRYCGSGPFLGEIPNPIGYPRQSYNRCQILSNVPIENGYDRNLPSHRSTGYVPGTVTTEHYCAVVYESDNRRSAPACIVWNEIAASELPPIVQIGMASSLSPQFQEWYFGNGGSTRDHNIALGIRAIYDNTYPYAAGTTPAPTWVYFDCAWDNEEFSRCPGGLGGWGLDAHTLTRVDDVSDGNHYVKVKARYANSRESSEAVFRWCVSPTGVCDDNSQNRYFIPIYQRMSDRGNLLPINESVVIPDAGVNQLVIENEKAKLSGVVGVKSGLLDNKTGTTNIKFLWNQTEGPKVKLNSTESRTVEFIAPSVKNDILLKFNLTVTDLKGIKSSDTTSLFLVTNENRQKIENFCDGVLTKALGQINDAKDKDNTDNQTLRHTQLAMKYLSECPDSNQYSKLGFPSNETGNAFPLVTETGKELVKGDTVLDSDIQGGKGADDASETSGGGETGTGDGSKVSEDKTPVNDEQDGQVEKGQPSLEDGKASCAPGDTYIPGEGCGPS